MARVAWNKSDLAGQRFTRLLVIEDAGRSPTNQVRWRCRCDCGQERLVATQKLRSGRSKSCGCLKAERIGKIATRHGLCSGGDHPLIRVYTHMIARCHYEGDADFELYGARGIYVCDRWRFGEDGRTGFDCFVQDMPDRPAGTSIDRKDNDGPYEVTNCRWATAKQQANNRRPARWTRWDMR